MNKIKNLVNKIESTKNGKELIQVLAASVALGVLLFLRSRGILVLGNFFFALVGGVTVFATLQYVTKKQKEKLLVSVLDEAEKTAEAENS